MFHKLKKRFYKVTGTLVNSLPEFIGIWIVRRMIKLQYSMPSEFEIKIAETEKEYEQAFKLVHNSYVEFNLAKDNPSRLRVTKYNALPTTVTLIIKDRTKDLVVATMSIIVDTKLGLPLESLWEIHKLRSKFSRIAEISALAIHEDYRSQRGKLLLPLCKYMFEVCSSYLNLDGIVIAIHPNAKLFYRGLFLFEYISKKIMTYDFVEGAKAVGLFLNVTDIQQRAFKTFRKKPNKYNIFHYVFEHKFSDNFVYPEKKFNQMTLKPLSPYILDYFFNIKTNTFSSMDTEDLKFLKKLYFYQDYQNIIGDKRIVAYDTRREPRFVAHLNGTVINLDTLENHQLKVHDVSKTGLCGSIQSKIPRGTQVIVKIDLNSTKEVIIHAECKSTLDNRTGFEIAYASGQTWHQFIEYLNDMYQHQQHTKDRHLHLVKKVA